MKAKSSIQKFIFSAVLLAGLAVLAYYLYHFSFLSPINYAQEAIAPLQSEFTAMGAQKLCENGDNGRMNDNREPWYGATYQIKGNKEEVVARVLKIMDDQGFMMTHASPSQRGFISTVADAYIDHWYFNDAHESPHADLEPGRVEVTMAVADIGDYTSCASAKVTEDTIFGVSVSLPSFKH